MNADDSSITVMLRCGLWWMKKSVETRRQHGANTALTNTITWISVALASNRLGATSACINDNRLFKRQLSDGQR